MKRNKKNNKMLTELENNINRTNIILNKIDGQILHLDILKQELNNNIDSQKKLQIHILEYYKNLEEQKNIIPKAIISYGRYK